MPNLLPKLHFLGRRIAINQSCRLKITWQTIQIHPFVCMHATKIRLFCTKNCLKSSTLSIHCLLLVGLINDVEYDHDMINDVEYDHDINDKTCVKPYGQISPWICSMS